MALVRTRRYAGRNLGGWRSWTNVAFLEPWRMMAFICLSVMNQILGSRCQTVMAMAVSLSRCRLFSAKGSWEVDVAIAK